MRTILAIVWGLLTVLLGWFATTAKAPQIEQDIRTRTAAAVAPSNAGAEIAVDGRFVTVKGPEANETSKARTLDAARAVYGALGPWDGLWVPKALAAIAPMVSAVKEAGGGLILSGAVGSDAMKTAIADAAKAAFSGIVENRISVSEAAGATELANVGEALGLLAKLNKGSAVLLPDRTLLFGAADDASLVDAAAALAGKAGWSVNVAGPAANPADGRIGELEAALAAAKAKGEAATAEAEALKARVADLEKAAAGGGEAAGKLLADLEAAKAALAAKDAEIAAAKQAAADCAARVEAAEKAAAEAKAAHDAAEARIVELEQALAAKAPAPAEPAAPKAPALTVETCDAAMIEALAKGGITFASNAAVIDPAASGVLDAVAANAVACARDAKLAVEVGGHTDDRGADDANLKLSQRRADAVRDALVLRGVPGESVRAAGYGETRPIADNATEEGRAANRRIEFKWSAQ